MVPGLVSELLLRADLLPRAWALAEHIARQPSLLLRYTRVRFTLKRQLVVVKDLFNRLTDPLSARTQGLE